MSPSPFLDLASLSQRPKAGRPDWPAEKTTNPADSLPMPARRTRRLNGRFT